MNLRKRLFLLSIKLVQFYYSLLRTQILELLNLFYTVYLCHNIIFDLFAWTGFTTVWLERDGLICKIKRVKQVSCFESTGLFLNLKLSSIGKMTIHTYYVCFGHFFHENCKTSHYLLLHNILCRYEATIMFILSTRQSIKNGQVGISKHYLSYFLKQ